MDQHAGPDAPTHTPNINTITLSVAWVGWGLIGTLSIPGADDIITPAAAALMRIALATLTIGALGFYLHRHTIGTVRRMLDEAVHRILAGLREGAAAGDVGGYAAGYAAGLEAAVRARNGSGGGVVTQMPPRGSTRS